MALILQLLLDRSDFFYQTWHICPLWNIARILKFHLEFSELYEFQIFETPLIQSLPKKLDIMYHPVRKSDFF